MVVGRREGSAEAFSPLSHPLLKPRDYELASVRRGSILVNGRMAGTLYLHYMIPLPLLSSTA